MTEEPEATAEGKATEEQEAATEKEVAGGPGIGNQNHQGQYMEYENDNDENEDEDGGEQNDNQPQQFPEEKGDQGAGGDSQEAAVGDISWGEDVEGWGQGWGGGWEEDHHYAKEDGWGEEVWDDQEYYNEGSASYAEKFQRGGRG